MNFINLTNGLSWINGLDNYSFIRIQSTTLERKDFIKLMKDLDHNFLLHLAIGTECKVYDCGTNRPYSKTIYTGIPLIRYILNRRWYGIIPDKVNILSRSGNPSYEVSNYFNNIYENLFRYDMNSEKISLKTKLDYYKRFLNSDQVNLQGISRSTSNDGKYQYFRETLLKSL